jgi:hypothetical protein
LLLFLAFEFVQAFAVTSIAGAAPVQALYVLSGTTLTTYNVELQTGKAKKIGTPLTLGSGVASWPLASSPDGHFLYVPCCFSGTPALSVYATDARAVPQGPAIQVIAGNFVQIQVDPNGRFAYGLTLDKDQSYNNIYSVHIFEIAEATGKLTELKIEYRYNEGTCCMWFNLDGFDTRGGKLYDDEGSDLGGGGGSLWYEQPVNRETGDLGQRLFLINGSYPGQGQYASVALGNKVIVRSQTVDSNPSNSYLDVYPHVSDPQTPLIHCTASMLNVCSYVTGLQLDPSQKNIFISGNPDPITVAQMNISQGNLVATGSTIPINQTVYFNNSGTLVYALQFNGSGTISIYKFDARTGKLTLGDQVNLGQSTFVPLVSPSERTGNNRGGTSFSAADDYE